MPGVSRVARPHRIELRLSDGEAAALGAAARDRGTSKAEILRAGIEGVGSPRKASPSSEVSTPTTLLEGVSGAAEPISRETVLAQLADAARAGSVVAMATLARELRLGGPPAAPFKVGPVD